MTQEVAGTREVGGTREIARHERSEQGFSLVEMMIASALLAVVMAVVLTSLVTSQKISTATQQRLTDTDDIELALQQVSTKLRTAVPTATTSSSTYAVFVSASATQVSFYGELGGTLGGTAAPTLVSLSLGSSTASPTTLVDSTTPPTGTPPYYSFAPTPTSTTIDAQNLNPAGGIFTYLSSAGTAITNQTGSWMQSIAAVEVTMTSAATSSGNESVLTTTVWLPNVDNNPTYYTETP